MKLLIRDSKNDVKTILVNESSKVLELKEEIQKKMDITGEIELVFNGMVLSDTDWLVDIDITDGCTIDYQGRFDAGTNKTNYIKFLLFL